MKNRLNLTWENAFIGLIFAFCGWILTMIVLSSTANHYVRGYYLDDFNGKLSIRLDIEWQEDGSILLDRSITYDEAISMVERLNKTIK